MRFQGFGHGFVLLLICGSGDDGVSKQFFESDGRGLAKERSRLQTTVRSMKGLSAWPAFRESSDDNRHEKCVQQPGSHYRGKGPPEGYCRRLSFGVPISRSWLEARDWQEYR